MNFEAQFSNPAMPAGLLLHAAVASYSPRWCGDQLHEDEPVEHEAVAARIAAARAEFYREIDSALEEFLLVACRSMDRRLRNGISPTNAVLLMHALFDGLVLRALVDPEAVPADLAADALYEFALAVTEDGGIGLDPRRPHDPAQSRLFNATVRAAIEALRQVPPGRSPKWGDIAAIAQQDVAVVKLVAPRIADLADSAARTLLAPIDASSESRLGISIVRTALRKLAREVDQNPALFAAIPPACERGGVLGDLVDSLCSTLAAAARQGTMMCRDPADTALRLINFAGRGSTGAEAVDAILDLMNVPADTG